MDDETLKLRRTRTRVVRATDGGSKNLVDLGLICLLHSIIHFESKVQVFSYAISMIFITSLKSGQIMWSGL